MKTLSLLLGVMLVAVCPDQVWAKRINPKPVPPVVYGGVRYEAPRGNGRVGEVEAFDVKTGKKLWDAVIYTVTIYPWLKNVQWVYISKMAIQGNALLVTNETGEQYILDLKTKTVSKGGLSARAVSWVGTSVLVLGVVLIVVGALVWLVECLDLPLACLPACVRMREKGWPFFFSGLTCIVVSIVFTVLLDLVAWLWGTVVTFLLYR